MQVDNMADNVDITQ